MSAYIGTNINLTKVSEYNAVEYIVCLQGDFVQLKALPCQGNTFELRGKSMDILIMVNTLFCKHN